MAFEFVSALFLTLGLLFPRTLLPMIGASLVNVFPEHDEAREKLDVIQETFLELSRGLLENDNLLLIILNSDYGNLDLMKALETGFPSNPILIFNENAFLDASPSSSLIRGSLATVVLIFQGNSTEFLNKLLHNTVWNPRYLVIWITNLNVNATRVIGHPVIQRSERIFLLQLIRREGRFIFHTSTSYPTKTDSEGHSMIKSSLGFWNTKYFTDKDMIFPLRYENFEGKLLELATWCDDTPFLHMVNGTCKGAMLDAVQMISGKLNFTYEIQHEPKDLRWGSKENGTWVGMLGDLQHNGKHIVINDFLLNEVRAKDFDFTYPYHAEGFAFLLRLPRPLPQWKNLLYPFTNTMWGVTIGTIFLVSAMICVLLYLLIGEKDLVEVFLVIIGSILRQNLRGTWDSVTWTRIWLATWGLAAFILSSAYTGNLIAVLTIPVYPKRIETLQELAASDVRPWVLDYGNLVPVSLRTSSDPTLAKLGEKLDVAYFDYNDPYASFFKMLPKGTSALIEAFYYLGYLQLSANSMDISYIMKDQIYWGHLSWFFPKNTPYTNLLSGALQSLREAGIINKLFQDYTAKMRNLAMKTKLTQQSQGGGVLSVSQLQGAFWLWLFGLSSASIIFILEILTAKLMKTKIIHFNPNIKISNLEP